MNPPLSITYWSGACFILIVFPFSISVGEVSFVELFVDENEKPRGCGIIEFSNASLAKDAVDKMHRFDLKGRKLVVKEVRIFYIYISFLSTNGLHLEIRWGSRCYFLYINDLYLTFRCIILSVLTSIMVIV